MKLSNTCTMSQILIVLIFAGNWDIRVNIGEIEFRPGVASFIMMSLHFHYQTGRNRDQTNSTLIDFLDHRVFTHPFFIQLGI